MKIARKLPLCFILLFSVASVFAQVGDSIVLNRERVFTGKALYGFMNGGSDLFFEYGFKELKALEVNYKGESYSIEIYKMDTPEDAYGIYSMHTYRCKSADSIQLYDCLSRFQLQTAKGDEYISIVFGNETKKTTDGAIELMQYYSGNVNAGNVIIPGQFVKEAPISGRLKYMRGELAISNVFPEFVKIVQNIANYRVWYLKSKEAGESRVLIQFADVADKEVVMSRLPIDKVLSEGDCFIFLCL